MLAFDMFDECSTRIADWRDHIHRLASSLVDTPDEFPRARREAKLLAQASIGQEVASSIAAINGSPDPQPVLLRGIPVFTDDHPASGLANDLFLLGIIEASDLEVFSYKEQKQGALVQDIVPIPGMEKSNSNAGRVPLGWQPYLLYEYR
jgi:L-asparagine oxygenase